MAESPQQLRRAGETQAIETASSVPRWRRALSHAVSRGATKWWITVWALSLVAAAVIAWIRCPAWLTDGESASTTIRNLGLVILAAVGLPVAIWRSVIAERQAQAAQRQSEIAGQNLLNDRFQKGTAMLGHPEIGSVRIGGIHALARLAAEYPDVFHLPVMQTLAAFVVDRTKRGGEKAEQESADPGEGGDYSDSAPFQVSLAAGSEVGPVPELPKDVEEAMRSIAQRSERQITVETDGIFRMNLADASMPGLIFHRADFSGFDFTKADMRRVRGWQARLARARLAGTDLSGATMHGADFRDADMRRVNLTAAKLVGADLRNVNLGLVDLAGENLWKGAIFPSKLVGTVLEAADLRNANIGGADMRGASLGAAKLDHADLRGVDLSGADLRAASLKGARLGGADMTNANFGGAGADLSGADLAGANLTGANLSNANFAGTNLDGANLTGTDFSKQQLDDDASPARGLTQRQLDQADADPANPPILEELLDCETNAPLLWRGASEARSGSRPE